MGAKMTEKEFEAFKEKAHYREPQTVKTFYNEPEHEDEILKRHQERRNMNRYLRDLTMGVQRPADFRQDLVSTPSPPREIGDYKNGRRERMNRYPYQKPGFFQRIAKFFRYIGYVIGFSIVIFVAIVVTQVMFPLPGVDPSNPMSYVMVAIKQYIPWL
jgi:hypothetical protein